MIEALVEEIVSKHPGARRDALIPILQEVQQAQGYLSREAIIQIGRRLGLPASKVYGVATFYNQFRFRAPGKFHVQVCRGTACHVKNSARLLEAVSKVACLGACGQAPILAVNGEFHAGVAPDRAADLMESYRRKAKGDGPTA